MTVDHGHGCAGTYGNQTTVKQTADQVFKHSIIVSPGLYADEKNWLRKIFTLVNLFEQTAYIVLAEGYSTGKNLRCNKKRGRRT
jgi:predicted alpha/beta superfamily hydrolase